MKAMEVIKIKDNKAYTLLKTLQEVHKDLRDVVDSEQWIPIKKKEMKIDNIKIIVNEEEIRIEILSNGDKLVEDVVKPILEKEEKERKKVVKLPEVFPFTEENKLHEYETKLKQQKFYIGEATLRKYPVCETMLVRVSYGYNESRKTVKRDVKGLYISFSGSVWNKMGAGRNLVRIRFSKLLLHEDYQNIGKLGLNKSNTINISSVSEYKGNRFYNITANHNERVKASILNKRESES